MDILFGIVALIVGAVVIAYSIKEVREQWRKEDAEYEAFEQHRAERQAEFDRRAQEVAHRVLIETCETIYIGRWQNANDQ